MKKLFCIFSFMIAIFSSCYEDDKNANEPQGSTPANYVGIWTTVQKQNEADKPIVLLLNADASGALSSTDITFQWKVDKNGTLWRKLGNEWNDLWKSSTASDSELIFRENEKTIQLKKITSPNPSEYIGTWKVSKAIQSIDGKWDKFEDVSDQYVGKSIAFSQDGKATIMSETRKWLVDSNRKIIWQYGMDYKYWEPLVIVDTPQNGKMSLLVSKSSEFLNLDFVKQ